MRYLKLYESLNYEEITDFFQKRQNKSTRISDELAIDIINLFKNNKYFSYRKTMDIHKTLIDIKVYEKHKKVWRTSIEIFIDNDDYFFLKITNTKLNLAKTFKCDQLIGLKKCLLKMKRYI